MSVLEIHGLRKSFGGLVAVDEVDLAIKRGEIVGLIGPNGSGKTTLFNCVTGLYEAETGRILFKNENIAGCSSYKIAQKGIARTFQLARVFQGLTLFENMVLAQNHLGEPFLRTPTRPFDQSLSDLTDHWLEFVGLSRLRNELAGEVSYGQQKLLEFAMILMPVPEVILLDVPTSCVYPFLIF